MATPLDNITQEVASALAGTPAGDLAVALLKSLSSIAPSQADFLSYSSLGNLIKSSNDDPELLRTVAYLSSPRFNILRPFFVFVGDDGEEQILSAKEWRDAKQNGFLVDRHSGAQVPDFERLTFPYFSVTEEFKKLSGNPRG